MYRQDFARSCVSQATFAARLWRGLLACLFALSLNSLSLAAVNKSIRVIYAVGSDRAIQSSSATGMVKAATDLQAWYPSQLNGKTILLNDPVVETCVLPKTAACYAGNSYSKVLADVTVCVPAMWNDPNFRWVIYADVDELCNDGRLGAGGGGTTIMGHNDIARLGGARTTTGSCGDTWTFPGFDSITGGLGHELGHALGLAHPAGCDQALPACDTNALMWAGYYNFPNTYLREDDKAALNVSPFLFAVQAAARKTMTEYYYARMDYYFVTSRDSDKALLDSLHDWQRTGKSFDVLAMPDASTPTPLSRFYFDKVAKAGARGSHFYTLLAADKTTLHSQNPNNQALPLKPYDEGIDGYAYLPLKAGVGGTSAATQKPVYREFRGSTRFPDDPNHRFTTDLALYNEFVGKGWDGEGVTFCVPN